MGLSRHITKYKLLMLCKSLGMVWSKESKTKSADGTNSYPEPILTTITHYHRHNIKRS